jgi:hypothetical protein
MELKINNPKTFSNKNIIPIGLTPLLALSVYTPRLLVKCRIIVYLNNSMPISASNNLPAKVVPVAINSIIKQSYSQTPVKDIYIYIIC